MLNVFQLKLGGALFFFTMVIGVFIARFFLSGTSFPREQKLGKNKTKWFLSNYSALKSRWIYLFGYFSNSAKNLER